MSKKKFYAEAAYVFGILLLALGTAFSERADFGMSMVVAPAYLVFLKVSKVLEWFTFGMAEYLLQALLLILMSVVLRRFKWKFLFSFCTAVFYGFVLDFWIFLLGFVPGEGLICRVLFFIGGILLCSAGVALLFHTYIAPEAYELLVKEISEQYQKDISVVKTIYDCTSCIIAILMSFAFFGFLRFEGVNVGTVICALVNGILIGKISKLLESHFEFCDALKWRKFFE